MNGNVDFDGYFFLGSRKQQIRYRNTGPKCPSLLANLDAEFIIDSEHDSGIRIGNWTNDDLQIVTDDTTRLTVQANGNIVVGTTGSDNARVNILVNWVLVFPILIVTLV